MNNFERNRQALSICRFSYFCEGRFSQSSYSCYETISRAIDLRGVNNHQREEVAVSDIEHSVEAVLGGRRVGKNSLEEVSVSKPPSASKTMIRFLPQPGWMNTNRSLPVARELIISNSP
jgi:hypothetical protein